MICTALLLLILAAQIPTDGVQAPVSVVSGKVFDAETGQPLKGIGVYLLRKTYDPFGIQRIVAIQSAVTNDDGEYRLSDISSLGDFYVGASSPAYRPVYFPGAADLLTAVPLYIVSGQELGGIDLKLSRVRLVQIRGRMLDALHVRQPHLSSVRIVPRYPLYLPYEFPSYRVALDGAFEILNVPPGSYYIVGQRIDDEPNRSRTVVPIEVRDDDIDDFQLIAAEGHDIRGQVRVEGSTIRQLVTPPMRQLNVVLKPIADPASLLEAAPAVYPDGTFVLPGLPSGEYRISVTGMPPEFYIKSARFGSVDVLENGISVRGVVAGSLDVVLSNNGGRIEGSVLDPGATSAGHGYVVLVPETPRPERSDLYKAVATGVDGRFTITGLAPGRYRMVTSPNFDPYTYRDPAFMEAFKDRSYRLSIAAGELVNVELRR
ncbi:MAG: hypothetical protein DMG13_14045 [Acidobacteria bacterium]|nr:MAG: hypothetical protein DMG13_14045 [Acidobacteriota bacterium]